ncbi:MAG TPA: hypothetical protein DHU93_16215, partial [Algoriphagus sp.]|nr:hypothetical protein [Algoriphagus sp.]
FNPFGFILDKGFEDSGWNHEYPHFNYQEVEKFLLPFLDRPEPVKYRDFITPIKSKSSGLVDFLVRLTEKIHQNWGHIIRHEQNIWAASLTYSTKKGSCRDLALMQMDMLKSLGLATRFVSGYAFNPDLEDGHELHAWLEVFLPGSGWVGMDPSLGLFTDHHYIPLAVHADPDATMPIQGAFLGSGKSELHTHVELKLIRARLVGHYCLFFRHFKNILIQGVFTKDYIRKAYLITDSTGRISFQGISCHYPWKH